MDATQTTTTEFSEGQMVRFQLYGEYVVGEIILATPSTQTVWYTGHTYTIHHTKLRLCGIPQE